MEQLRGEKSGRRAEKKRRFECPLPGALRGGKG
jgi:hypothetical protein